MNICYTAITGSHYDILFEDHFTHPNWKFVCYTTEDIQSKTWQIIKIDRKQHPIKQAREIKVSFPEGDYEHYLWVDANVHPIGDLNKFIKSFNIGDINVMKHPDRTNIIQELEAIVKYKKDKRKIVAHQLKKYQQKRYAINELAHTSILLRKKTKQTQEPISCVF